MTSVVEEQQQQPDSLNMVSKAKSRLKKILQSTLKRKIKMNGNQQHYR